MPPLPASATATRFASQWIADALAGDEALDFSVLKGEPQNPDLLLRSPAQLRSLPLGVVF
jgi:hypothetical protein